MEGVSAELAATLAVADRERAALAASDHAAFAQCAEEKDEALARLLRRQNETVIAMSRAGAALGLPAGETNFSAVRDHIPEPARRRLVDLAGQIRRRLDDLHECSAQNLELIRNVLSYYDFLANLIIEAFTDQPEYGPPSKADSAPPIIMDRRA